MKIGKKMNKKSVSFRLQRDELIINQKDINNFIVDNQDKTRQFQHNKFNKSQRNIQVDSFGFSDRDKLNRRKTQRIEQTSSISKFHNFKPQKMEKNKQDFSFSNVAKREEPNQLENTRSKFKSFILNNILNQSKVPQLDVPLTKHSHSKTESISFFPKKKQNNDKRYTVEIFKQNGQDSKQMNLIEKRKVSADSSIISQRIKSKKKKVFKAQTQSNRLNSQLSGVKQSVNSQKFYVRSRQINITQQSQKQQFIKKQTLSQLQKSNNSQKIQNYQEQIEKITKSFLEEFQNFAFTRGQLRKMLLQMYFQAFPAKNQNLQTKKMSLRISLNKKDSIQLKPPHLMNSNYTISNNLTATQVKQYQEQYKSYDQKNKVKVMLKNAHFWSRSRQKNFNTEYEKNSEDAINVRVNLSENWSYYNYIKKKRKAKELFSGKYKAYNLIKCKQQILKLEEQGSKEQQYLRCCLQDAIEKYLTKTT